MSTPHVADAMISFPSAKLKYGGVRISFLVWWTSTLANEATSNHLAILTVDRSSPPPSAPLVSRLLARRVLFRNYRRILSSFPYILFLSLSHSRSLFGRIHERREEMLMKPEWLLGIDWIYTWILTGRRSSRTDGL